MSNPLVLHIVRPYATEEAYLEAEAWSIEAKTMLLIGQRKLPEDATVLFDVALSSGEKVIKAEARVIGFVPAADGRPAGVRVRFKRFGAMTKAFIDRALAAQRQASEAAERAALVEADASPRPEATPSQSESKSLDANEQSGVHHRVARRVPPPPNREELLEKLRMRSRALKSARRLPDGERTSAEQSA